MKPRSIGLGAALLLVVVLTIFSEPPADEIAAPIIKSKPLPAAANNSPRRADATASASASVSAKSAATSSTTAAALVAGKSELSTEKIEINLLQDRRELLGVHSGETNLVENRPGVALRPPSEKKPVVAKKSASASPASTPATTTLDNPGRDRLFASHNWTPPPPPPPPPPPAPPPSAPPLPFIYIGKKLEEQKWEVYLARGTQTVVAQEKGKIDGIYEVVSIKPPSMTFIYLPLKQTQTLSIGGSD